MVHGRGEGAVWGKGAEGEGVRVQRAKDEDAG